MYDGFLCTGATLSLFQLLPTVESEKLAEKLARDSWDINSNSD
jgi:hypothetical protein